MKKVIAIFFLLLDLLIANPLSAKDMSDLYDDATLERWWNTKGTAGYTNGENIRWNFETAILGKLTYEEKQVLGNVRVEFPLRGVNNSVFEFYVSGSYESGYTVTIPILSLRFLRDTALAYLWLEENGYNGVTVFQYIGMLKYKTANQFPDNRYPRPFDALQIPDDPLDDPKVAEVYSNSNPMDTMTMMFIMCHELGHAYHHHPGYDGITHEQARKNEAEADKFAVKLMKRIGMVPGGAAFWFTTLIRWETHRCDFETDEEWEEHLRESTHPLTAHRIRSLAKEIEVYADDFAMVQPDYCKGLERVHYIVRLIRGIAENLEDENLHQMLRIEGLVTEPRMLEPRQSETYVIKPSSREYPNISFSGIYDGQITPVVGKNMDTRVLFERSGDHIYGVFTHDVEYGVIDGDVEGDVLYFDWRQKAGAYGRGKFRATDGGRAFTGTLGFEDSRDNGGTWDGRRK